ncbi:MAG: 3-hydroxyacyl-ACP dehydratase FabZ [Firmicutes bacterium]|nr:3-hydroxyacyl-ACP dehydratase FabZ [Bacillota bacterium]
MSRQWNHQWIKDRLPHRWPFLHVDRVTKITGKSIEGYKNVSASDSVFLGHFQEVSVLPGVIVVEALAQLSGLFLLANEEEAATDDDVDIAAKIGLLTSIRNFKFIKIIEPGDQLLLKSILKGSNGDCYVFAVSAYVDNREVAVGELQLFLQKREAVI